MPIPRLLLASASPRRAELLRQLGCDFEVSPADINETPLPKEDPVDYVQRMALEKATAGWQLQKQERGKLQLLCPVMGADTTVVSGGKIFGKPANQADAVDTLLLLSDKVHQVMSAVAMVNDDVNQVVCSITHVHFRSLTEQEAICYWQTGEPVGKAGSYAIQGFGASFISRIEGSYSGVVGLPLMETSALLNDFGVPYWNKSKA